MHDVLVFDDYRGVHAPRRDPGVAVRDALLARLPAGIALQSAAAHDREHSLEALAYWLRHVRPDVEIVPIIVPAASFDRLQQLSQAAASALAAVMRERGLKLGKDVAIAIWSDAVHYGAELLHTPYGDGGVAPFVNAYARDAELFTGPLAGTMTPAKVREFSAACVDQGLDRYGLAWCGRLLDPARPAAAAGHRRRPRTGRGGRAPDLLLHLGQPARAALHDAGMGAAAPAGHPAS